MNNEDLKKQCAKEALKLISNNTIIGLGGGSTISYLIKDIIHNELNVKIVTPSFKTKMLCVENGLEVLHTSTVEKVTVAFDGCDEVDEDLNALKSAGGIHTKEKLIASMAEEYVLLVDESKVVKELSFKHPVVLEVLEDSIQYVMARTREAGGVPKLRISSAKDGCTITENGNVLIDVMYQRVENIAELDRKLNNIKGIIDTSLFVNLATKALVTSDEGIRIIESKLKRG